MIFILFESARYGKFFVKNIFSTLVHSTPNLKMLPLHCIPKILYADSFDTRLIYPCKKFSPITESLSTKHRLHVPTDKQTDGRQTDNNGTIDAYA